MIKNNIFIKDNFLDDETFSKIENEFMSRNFNWNYQNTVVDNTDDELLNPDIYQFCHLIWSIHDGGILSDYYNCIKPLLNMLNAVSILKIKANLLTKRDHQKPFKYHRDFAYPTAKTSIFYLNTNNGSTIFENGQKIDSVKNRMITFDNSLLHTGTPCSDKSVRVLLNFNYFDY